MFSCPSRSLTYANASRFKAKSLRAKLLPLPLCRNAMAFRSHLFHEWSYPRGPSCLPVVLWFDPTLRIRSMYHVWNSKCWMWKWCGLKPASPRWFPITASSISFLASSFYILHMSLTMASCWANCTCFHAEPIILVHSQTITNDI